MSQKDFLVLSKVIEFTDMLSDKQKSFLLDNLDNLSPLEVLKLKHALMNKLPPELVQIFNTIIARFSKEYEEKKAKDVVKSKSSNTEIKSAKSEAKTPISGEKKDQDALNNGEIHNKHILGNQKTENTDDKLVDKPVKEERNRFSKEIRSAVKNQFKELEENPVEQEQKVLSYAVLSDSKYLCQEKPTAIDRQSEDLVKLNDIVDLAQLNQLNPEHVRFRLDENVEQVLHEFFVKTEKMFRASKDIKERRDYMMTFLQSQLFTSYLNTGLTALRHPEIRPRNTILNTLHKTNDQYLSKKQFQYAALVSHHIRGLAVV